MLRNPEGFGEDKRWTEKPSVDADAEKTQQVKHMRDRCADLIVSKTRPDFKQSYLTGVLDGLSVALHILDDEEVLTEEDIEECRDQ